MTPSPPHRPRAARQRRTPVQNVYASEGPVATPSTSRFPSRFTATAILAARLTFVRRSGRARTVSSGGRHRAGQRPGGPPAPARLHLGRMEPEVSHSGAIGTRQMASAPHLPVGAGRCRHGRRSRRRRRVLPSALTWILDMLPPPMEQMQKQVMAHAPKTPATPSPGNPLDPPTPAS